MPLGVPRRARLSREGLVDLIVQFLHWLFGIINALTGGLLEKLFGLKGTPASRGGTTTTPGPNPKTIPVPANTKILRNELDKFVNDMNLNGIFEPNDPFISTVVDKAANFVAYEDASTGLNTPGNIKDLTKLTLFRSVIYCDDSSSMNLDDRIEALTEIVKRITRITTRLLPEDEGIELRFINAATEPAFSKVKDPDWVQQRISTSSMSYQGNTMIGTNLKSKILEPLVYEPARNRQLNRPVLISIITDGEPTGEPVNHLRDMIVECQAVLKQFNYDPKSVLFQISQIGNASGATSFLQSLKQDPIINEIVDFPPDKLDMKLEHLRGDELALEGWLFKTLLGPILSKVQ